MPAEALKPLLDEATARLKAAGCETPALDARLLLQAAAGVSREEIILAPQRMVPDENRFERSPEQPDDVERAQVRRVARDELPGECGSRGVDPGLPLHVRPKPKLVGASGARVAVCREDLRIVQPVLLGETELARRESGAWRAERLGE